MSKITIFLADWQVLFREGIHFTLSGEEDIEVVGEGTSNDEVLAFLENNSPSIVVLNINHGQPSGIEVVRVLHRNQPGIATILVMDNENPERLFEVLSSGAHACLTKDIDPKDVVEVVRQVAEGILPIAKTMLKPEIASMVLQDFQDCSSLSPQVGNLMASLSPREADILKRLADKQPAEQIREETGSSEPAFQNYLEFILQKLVNNRQNRDLITAAQSALLSAAPRAGLNGHPGDYITRKEFEEFKEKLLERFKSFAGEFRG